MILVVMLPNLDVVVITKEPKLIMMELTVDANIVNMVVVQMEKLKEKIIMVLIVLVLILNMDVVMIK